MGGGRTTLNDPVVMVLIAGAALALLLGLGWSPLFLYDESLYCGVTADMDQHQQWLYATDDGEFFGWYGKPPLINWLQKLSTTIFGWSIWALRLPTALGMLALIGLVIKTGSWLGGRDLGLLSGAAVLLSARMVHTGRHILLEDLVVPLFAAALLLWAIALEEQQRRQKPHWLALVGAGLTVAAAILTKQAFAAFAP
ncbi:MAG: glycosyltransferase family 39 protein, partial [Myxococcota bacterium]